MTLREDGEPYCFLWVGVLILGSYFFSFIFLSYDIPGYFDSMLVFLLPLVVFPLLLVFTFIGFLRPVKSKAKPTMLALSIVLALFFWILTITMETLSILSPGEGIGITIWGVGGALLTAAGFSIMHSLEESTTDGILDVSALHYGPPLVEEEPEPAPEPEADEPTDSDDSAESTPEAS
ncbi:MAG: hypothetical protein RTU30_06570 [Candidatus Thorarchaeota archaeon]